MRRTAAMAGWRKRLLGYAGKFRDRDPSLLLSAAIDHIDPQAQTSEV
jgi:hypothetical protein